MYIITGVNVWIGSRILKKSTSKWSTASTRGTYLIREEGSKAIILSFTLSSSPVAATRSKCFLQINNGCAAIVGKVTGRPNTTVEGDVAPAQASVRANRGNGKTTSFATRGWLEF